MARTKTYNPAMGGLRDMIASYMGKQTDIRAEYARLAEEKIAALRREVLEEMFIVHAGAGASEIANSTGLSRTTVVRWRKEFLDGDFAEAIAGYDALAAEEAVPAPEASDKPYAAVGVAKYDGVPTAYASTGEGDLYLLTGEDFGIGDTPYEAEDNRVDRPEWLTDEVMKEIVTEADVKLLLAPW